MGMFNIVMEVGDPSGERYVPFSGLVDTGSTLTALPESLLTSLGVVPEATGVFELADNRSVERRYGFTRMRYNGRSVVAPVAFAEDDASPLIGATTLEIFAQMVDPVRNRLVPVNFQMR